MQRIGMLYFVCKNASESQGVTADVLARKIKLELRALVSVDWDIVAPYFAHYRGFPQRYKGKRAPYRDIEYQDVLLAEPALPSSSGALSDDVFPDVIDEAVMLRLLRSTSNTLTDRGKCLLHLWTKLDNPLLLDNTCKMIATYWYLSEDGDAVRAIYRELLDNSTFTREGLGIAVEQAIEKLLRGAKATTVADRELFARLKKTLHAIKRQPMASTGSGIPSYQATTMRAEHPVDLGLLSKPKSGEYAYDFPVSSLLLTVARTDGDIKTFLDSALAKELSASMGWSLTTVQPDDCWSTFLEAYHVLCNRLGYASLHESCVLTQALGVEQKMLIEVGPLKSMVLKRQQRNGIRVAIGRNGEPDFIKVTNG